MLPRVQRWLCLVAAPLALTVDAAGATDSRLLHASHATEATGHA